MHVQSPADTHCTGVLCGAKGAAYTYDRAMQYYKVMPGMLTHSSPPAIERQDTNASAYVQHCLKSLEKAANGNRKEGLAIVVSVSLERQSDAELQHAMDNMKQYASRHEYTFYLQLIPQSTSLHFFSMRWLELVASQIWERHEYILHLDSDSVFIDFQKSLGKWTSSPQHIFLQIRLNKEVTAAAVLVRTSAFAECFLRMWAGKGLIERTNHDNGDLLALMLDFAAPDLVDVCDRLRDADYEAQYIVCFSKAHARLLLLTDYMPISVAPPLGGFQKSLEGLGLYETDKAFQAEHPDHFKLVMRCWSSDLIGHGSKAIGTIFWAGRADHNSVVPNCLYNTPEEELEVARRCCLWHYPGCVIDGQNVCKAEPHCSESTGAFPGQHCK